MSLLRNYIKALIRERVRPSAFSIEAFKKLEWQEMKSYLDTYLVRLGKGSSRIVFRYSSSYVIKLAFNDAGLAQNEQEIHVFNDDTMKPLVAKIKDYDRHGRWTLSEIVRPLHNDSEFFQLLGLKPGKNMNGNVVVNWGSTVNEVVMKLHMTSEKTLEKVLASAPDIARTKLKSIWYAMHHADLAYGDLKEYHHWGKSSSGELALLDYGFSNEISNEYYSSSGGLK